MISFEREMKKNIPIYVSDVPLYVLPPLMYKNKFISLPSGAKIT